MSEYGRPLSSPDFSLTGADEGELFKHAIEHGKILRRKIGKCNEYDGKILEVSWLARTNIIEHFRW
jgi:hypothetical protein